MSATRQADETNYVTSATRMAGVRGIWNTPLAVPPPEMTHRSYTKRPPSGATAADYIMDYLRLVI